MLNFWWKENSCGSAARIWTRGLGLVPIDVCMWSKWVGKHWLNQCEISCSNGHAHVKIGVNSAAVAAVSRSCHDFFCDLIAWMYRGEKFSKDRRRKFIIWIIYAKVTWVWSWHIFLNPGMCCGHCLICWSTVFGIEHLGCVEGINSVRTGEEKSSFGWFMQKLGGVEVRSFFSNPGSL